MLKLSDLVFRAADEPLPKLTIHLPAVQTPVEPPPPPPKKLKLSLNFGGGASGKASLMCNDALLTASRCTVASRGI